MKDNQQTKEIQIELPENIAEGVYANLVIVSHSDSEFIFDFSRFLPGKPKAKIHARIIMTPKNAKLFLRALQDNVNKFEANFGKIRIEGEAANKFGIKVDDNTTVN